MVLGWGLGSIHQLLNGFWDENKPLDQKGCGFCGLNTEVQHMSPERRLSFSLEDPVMIFESVMAIWYNYDIQSKNNGAKYIF